MGKSNKTTTTNGVDPASGQFRDSAYTAAQDVAKFQRGGADQAYGGPWVAGPNGVQQGLAQYGQGFMGNGFRGANGFDQQAAGFGMGQQGMMQGAGAQGVGLNALGQQAGMLPGALQGLQQTAQGQNAANGYLGMAGQGFEAGQASLAQQAGAFGGGLAGLGAQAGFLPGAMQSLQQAAAGQNAAQGSLGMAGQGFGAGQASLNQQAGALGDGLDGMRQQAGALGGGLAQAQRAGAGMPDSSQFMNPYQQQVIDATRDQFANTRDRTNMAISDQATRAGAFGGSREAVTRGEAMRGVARDENAALAGLNSQGYADAMNRAQQQQQFGFNSGMGLAQFGSQGANQLAGIGANAGSQMFQGGLGANQFLASQGQNAAGQLASLGSQGANQMASIGANAGSQMAQNGMSANQFMAGQGFNANTQLGQFGGMAGNQLANFGQNANNTLINQGADGFRNNFNAGQYGAGLFGGYGNQMQQAEQGQFDANRAQFDYNSQGQVRGLQSMLGASNALQGLTGRTTTQEQQQSPWSTALGLGGMLAGGPLGGMIGKGLGGMFGGRPSAAQSQFAGQSIAGMGFNPFGR